MKEILGLIAEAIGRKAAPKEEVGIAPKEIQEKFAAFSDEEDEVLAMIEKDVRELKRKHDAEIGELKQKNLKRGEMLSERSQAIWKEVYEVMNLDPKQHYTFSRKTGIVSRFIEEGK